MLPRFATQKIDTLRWGVPIDTTCLGVARGKRGMISAWTKKADLLPVTPVWKVPRSFTTTAKRTTGGLVTPDRKTGGFPVVSKFLGSATSKDSKSAI